MHNCAESLSDVVECLHGVSGLDLLIELGEKEREVRRMGELLEDQDRMRLCCVCLSRNSCVLFSPCSHVCVCADCNDRVFDCPMCRRTIACTRRVYFS